jgi:hypothetical protein
MNKRKKIRTACSDIYLNKTGLGDLSGEHITQGYNQCKVEHTTSYKLANKKLPPSKIYAIRPITKDHFHGKFANNTNMTNS